MRDPKHATSATRVSEEENPNLEQHHYVVAVRYPPYMQALPTDRIALVLQKARDNYGSVSYLWVRLTSPSAGECFLMLRPEKKAMAPDGHQWLAQHVLADRRPLGSANAALDLCVFLSHASRLIRVEYRLAGAGHPFVLVQYLGVDQLPVFQRSLTGAVGNAASSSRSSASARAGNTSMARGKTTGAEKKTSKSTSTSVDQMHEDVTAVVDHCLMRMAARQSLLERIVSGNRSVFSLGADNSVSEEALLKQVSEAEVELDQAEVELKEMKCRPKLETDIKSDDDVLVLMQQYCDACSLGKVVVMPSALHYD